MDEEQILLELQKRNVNVNSLMSSSDNILQELKSRGFEETKDGSFLPTVEQQRKEQVLMEQLLMTWKFQKQIQDRKQ